MMPRSVADFAVYLFAYCATASLLHFVGAPTWAALGFGVVVGLQATA